MIMSLDFIDVIGHMAQSYMTDYIEFISTYNGWTLIIMGRHSLYVVYGGCLVLFCVDVFEM